VPQALLRSTVQQYSSRAAEEAAGGGGGGTPPGRAAIGIRPTGWRDTDDSAEGSSWAAGGDADGIYSVPYSLHSSFEALGKFVRRLAPSRISPVVSGEEIDPNRHWRQHCSRAAAAPVVSAVGVEGGVSSGAVCVAQHESEASAAPVRFKRRRRRPMLARPAGACLAAAPDAGAGGDNFQDDGAGSIDDLLRVVTNEAASSSAAAAAPPVHAAAAAAPVAEQPEGKQPAQPRRVKNRRPAAVRPKKAA